MTDREYSTIAELAASIERAEIMSEARAILDYSIHGLRCKEWIVSHERLRRDFEIIERQRDALQNQITRMLSEQLERDAINVAKTRFEP